MRTLADCRAQFVGYFRFGMVHNPPKGSGSPGGSPSQKSVNDAAAVAGAAAAASKRTKNGSFFSVFRSKLDSHSANVRAAAGRKTT